MYNYITNEFNDKKSSSDDFSSKHNKLHCLRNTFANYGGILSKISQILSYAEGDMNNDVFSNCKPYNAEKTLAFLKNEMKSNPEFFKPLQSLDLKVFKSGSIGQVHKGFLLDNTEVILKVQYFGLDKQFETDLKILDSLVNYLYTNNSGLLNNALKHIHEKLFEELDYNHEYLNQQQLYDIWEIENQHENIHIPKLIPELCTDKILCMEFIDGLCLNDFLEIATQEEKNYIGMKLLHFTFTNIYKYNIFYSDIHYGNFIIKDKNILYITDFGCINSIDEDLKNNLKNLHYALLKDDREKFFELIKTMEMDINYEESFEEDDSDEIKNKKISDSEDYMYEYFKLQYEPWCSLDFHFTTEWVHKASQKDVNMMKNWKLPPHVVYLNKIPYGLFHVFSKLNMSGNFLEFFNQLHKW
jgi:ubiquinone biosynthesis protein